MLLDVQLISTTVPLCIIVYYLLSLVYQKSQVPILVSTFIFTNMISRTSMFRSIVENAQLTLKQQITNIPKSAGINYQNFVNLNDVQNEVLTAIQSLKSYETSSKAQNDRRRKLFQRMSYKQQKACKDIGYLKNWIKSIMLSVPITNLLMMLLTMLSLNMEFR